MVTAFLSIPDIQARWSCSRAHVYRAIAEMDRDGYLRRLLLGRSTHQRISVESVEAWERLHSTPQVEDRAPVARLREPIRPRKKTPPPVQRGGGDDLREFARALYS